MVHILVLLLSLSQLNTLTFSESIDSPSLAINSDDSNLQPEIPPDVADYPIIKTTNDETEIDFDDPISSVNIDYLNNAIILQFRKQRQKQRKQALLDKNFMRFGKRQAETMPEQSILDSFKPTTRFERSNGAEGIRDSRGDNFMRFGRSVGGSKNLMRFGRSSNDFMRFGRSPSNFMRFGRSPSDFMRFGRSPSDFMRFGRSPSDFMRFGRSPSDFMRFGRSPSDFMRFGRSPSNFMRFGRSPSDFMRFGRSPSDFMRFGRSPSDFMRFGRSSNQNLMRFGRSNSMSTGRSDDSFMRFGKADGSSRSEIDKNFMRFGRPDSFMRFGRSSTPDTNNSFMRFGKRQKDDSNSSTTEPNHSEKNHKAPVSTDTSTTSPFQELDNDLDSIDLLYLSDLSDAMANDEN